MSWPPKKLRWRLALAFAVVAGVAAAVLLWSAREEKRRKVEKRRQEAEEELPTGPMLGKHGECIADKAEFWVNGEEVEFEELRAKPILLFFWDPEADGASVPHVVELAQAFGSRGLATIGICFLSEPAEPEDLVRAAEGIASEHELPFRLAIDCDAGLRADYTIAETGMPYCYLLDTAHVIVWEGPPEKLTARRVGTVLPFDER